MFASSVSEDDSDDPSRTVKDAQRLLHEALEILDQSEAPPEIRARLNDVIESVSALGEDEGA